MMAQMKASVTMASEPGAMPRTSSEHEAMSMKAPKQAKMPASTRKAMPQFISELFIQFVAQMPPVWLLHDCGAKARAGRAR